MTTFYEKLLAKKSGWEPICGPVTEVAAGAEDCLGRTIALRELELPVGDWISQACTKEQERLTPDLRTLLLSNIEDEKNHDIVLRKVDDTYRLTTDTHRAEARVIMDAWSSHPDHPIVKAAVAENGVFFVILPLMRFYGGHSMRVVANDISNDENIHVSTNRQAAIDLGLKWSPSLDKLRIDTVAWFVQSLDTRAWLQANQGVSLSPRMGKPDHWIKASSELMHKSITKFLDDTQAAVMHSFFEAKNSALPRYK